MIAYDVAQRTEEWFKIRLGVPTASNFDKIVTAMGEPSKQAQKYMYKLAGEKITGKSEDCFSSDDMQRGTELESEAIEFYEILNDTQVRKVGFVFDDSTRYGCSPDGLVGESGGLEIKCPQMATHVGYLVEGKLPIEYYQQVQGSLLITGREWWDFLSYYPGLKPFMFRVYPDLIFLKNLSAHLNQFCIFLEKTIERISQ